MRERGAVHPHDVTAHFAHGTVTNYWGGSSSATTHLLEHMHYNGLLRVVRREGGIRIYAAVEQQLPPPGAVARRQQIDALVDVLVRTYAPVPAPSLPRLISRLRYAVPQWRGELKGALPRARQRLSNVRVEGMEWYWPTGERVALDVPLQRVRLLAPFDPLVWDRWRFELLWGWAYRFEAYTPVPQRKLGYYALPLLWIDRVIGWANVSIRNGSLVDDVGYVASPPSDRAFKRELDRRARSHAPLSGIVNPCNTCRAMRSLARASATCRPTTWWSCGWRSPPGSSKYGFAIEYRDLEPPRTGIFDGLRIVIDPDVGFEMQCFLLLHLFGHSVQWVAPSIEHKLGDLQAHRGPCTDSCRCCTTTSSRPRGSDCGCCTSAA